MEVNLKVYRHDPENESAPSYQKYHLDVPESATVLDALLKIREEEDGTLSFRCSCRSAICGSCSMRIDHHAKLACKTKVVSLGPEDHEITVEPMGNLPVIKDLVVNMEPFWAKVRAVDPWLKPSGPEPEREHLVPNERMLELAEVMNCIMCGACVSDCTALAVDKSFLGPAALAKAYRFVHDPRDGAEQARLKMLSEPTGVWDCAHCFQCVEVCPKGVAPMERIMAMRRLAVESGYTDNNGSRHMLAFAESIKKSGWLDEVGITVDSFGKFNIPALLSLAPTGLRALLANKMPPLIHHSRPGAENVKKIFEKLEE
ncbi:MAG: Succinate dehydrogenase iron-sulfur subunit [Dehalococcoidia bacterium]|nr:Succinate dehydrogenase iron-sulfur subunit [Dehalococcoidia bacterium]